MNMNCIRQWLHREPFEPFELRLSSGETHQVRHPQSVALAKTRIAIAYPDTDRVVHCSLDQIDSIEAIQPPSTNAEAIQAMLRRQPFAPFKVHLSNGETHEIRRPECVIALKSNLFVGYPENDRFAIIPMPEVAKLQPLGPA